MRLCAQTRRAQALWMSVEVVVGVRIVQCHAIMNVVIGVCVMQCHAIIDVVIGVRVMLCHQAMDVVIGVRVMLCHQAIDNSGFPTFILLSSCINSSSLFPAAILCTLLHRENVIRGVVFTHPVGYSRPPSAVNDPSVPK